jgi:sigma-E factor negative regulatory protein RseC
MPLQGDRGGRYISMEQGFVVEIRGNKILVETGIASLCGSCTMSHSCVIGADGSKRRLWMDNDGSARVGDEVTFDIAERAVVMSALVVYLLPAVMLIAGIVAGASAGATLGLEGELPLIAGGVAGLLLSAAAAWVVSNIMKTKKGSEPRLVDITRRSDTINCG